MIHSSSHPDYFFTDEMPSGYSSKAKFFFSQEDFLKQQRLPDISFYLVHQQQRKIVGLAFFYRSKDGWGSPMKAPFGGFDIFSSPSEIKREFIKFVLSELSGTIRLRTFPAAYDPDLHDLIDSALMNSGFRSIQEEPNHHIPVDSEPISNKLHDMEKRKLRASMDLDFDFKEENLSAIGRIYDFIRHRRNEMSYGLSMSRSEVIETVNQVPGHYHLFSVYSAGELAATTISVVINQDVLYNFYPADHSEYRKHSPSVFLNAGLYSFCQDHGYRILDLGTSFLEGKPNDSLIAFKERMGGVLSLRKTYQRD